MDGIGLATEDKSMGDAVRHAHTPCLDQLMKEEPWISLKAHGTAVGLPSDKDMGNSEVGHNALGCGQIYAQGAKLVNQALEDHSIFSFPTWKKLIQNVKENQSTLHLLGLLSDGNVHSHIDHLKALTKQAKKEGLKKVRVHVLFDGRDVHPTSGGAYLEDIESFFNSLRSPSFDVRIASGGGRMYMTMDRYKADWAMVERGWKHHVLGQGRSFRSAKKAYEILREETGSIDQDLPGFVIQEDDLPIGKMEDGDSVIFFNFRGDRAMELSMAFDDDYFPYFDRGQRPDVFYAGMLEYDGDLKIPKNYLLNPPHIQNTLTELLVNNGIKEFACSETQKFGHVTYFWNGNRTEKFDENLECYLEIPSDTLPFQERPWMKSAEITDALIKAIKSEDFSFLRINYPNGDMVGHTGDFRAARMAVEAVDLGLSRIIPLAKKLGYITLITADHGNSDDMLEKDKKTGQYLPRTAHSLNPVPFLLVDPNKKHLLKDDLDGKAGLANVASTVAELLGLKKHPSWEESLLKE